MNNLFQQLKHESQEIVSQKRPKFYEHFAPELSYSREIFFDHPLIIRCREDVLPFLYDEYGHGIEHSKCVAVESGAIILGEMFYTDFKLGRHLVVLSQLSGLLHDICRMEPDHAREGADLTRKILKDFPLSDEDKEMISLAIRNHEAFKSFSAPEDENAALICNALYDGDKFRWGPDNFVTTLWEICDYQEWSLEKIVEQFPKALEIIESIAHTFRTQTGQIYGPEFIQIGLDVGNYLYRRMKRIC